MRSALFIISVAFFLFSAVELDGRREFGDGSLELVSTAGADARDRVDRISGTRKACGGHGVSGCVAVPDSFPAAAAAVAIAVTVSVRSKTCENSMPGPCDAWGWLPRRVNSVVASGGRRMVNLGDGLVDPCKPVVFTCHYQRCRHTRSRHLHMSLR
jgi:hypothetical protein